ncbi:SHOCT domain-containing protein [Shouchella shacheensis]|uniref:SHOCT domain-containing protein n=1 Tax=Shouchella shacheensis TaxID=1649580 RepID=UPI00073FB756|nr:SHOCT domain-containing protein [Shouchella shacheensis]
MMGDGMMNTGMVLYMIFTIFIVGLLIYGVITFVMKFFDRRERKSADAAGGDSAIQMLKERFARGEISEDEFERKYKIIKEEN